jgi:cobalt/nickel-transporting P-type ATPase D
MQVGHWYTCFDFGYSSANSCAARGLNVIGIDTENESIKSYKGYLWLIQISTHSHDFVVDLIEIGDSEFVAGTLGQKVLANPSIVKVLHGSSSDKQWILRDFEVAIQNVFDTQDLFQSLGGSKLALHNLWRSFCNYHMNAETKVKFQTGNWSQRPLPAEMLEYAATDSRYLIYLRCKLLLIALEGPDVNTKKTNPGIRHKLNVKQLNKVHTKMQKINKDSNQDWRLSSPSPSQLSDLCKTTLKKLLKSESDPLNLTTTTIFKTVFIKRESYCISSNINPDYILPPTYLYWFSKSPWDLPKILPKLSHCPLPSSLVPHRTHLTSFMESLLSNVNLNQLETAKEDEQFYDEIKKELDEIEEVKKRGEVKIRQKKDRRKTVMDKFSLKRPIYENWQILAPDGEILCKWDKKKVEWYLERDLATLISEDPLTVKLKFEPSGRGVQWFDGQPDDDEFYVENRKNQWVVCGKEQDYLRFQIIPSRFRIFFPNRFKSHRSHDVLLLWFDWNEKATKGQALLIEKLSKEYNVPTKLLDTDAQNKENVKFYQRKPRWIVRGKQVFEGVQKIPDDRLQDMYIEFIEESKKILESKSLMTEYEDQLKEELKKAEGEEYKLNIEFWEKTLKYKAKKTSVVGTNFNGFLSLIITYLKWTTNCPI